MAGWEAGACGYGEPVLRAEEIPVVCDGEQAVAEAIEVEGRSLGNDLCFHGKSSCGGVHGGCGRSGN